MHMDMDMDMGMGMDMDMAADFDELGGELRLLGGQIGQILPTLEELRDGHRRGVRERGG